MIYSFSIFNTLLMNSTATPNGIFALMQNELLRLKIYEKISPYIRGNFYQLRLHAEELARLEHERNGVEEVTLLQIYEALATSGNLRKEEEKLLIELEYKILSENIIVLFENIQQIKSLQRDGARIILLSDTYFPETFLRNLLEKIDSIFMYIPIYVSSQFKLKKATGHLYKKISSIEKVEYTNWFHFGSAYFSDILIPQSIGIKTKLLTEESLLQIEKQALQNQEDDVLSQLVAGAAKKCRQINHLKGTGAVGCSVAGPILFAYAQWIVETSRQRGVKRLYFIARDGYILKKIIDILLAKWNIDIKTHYLYGSRKAWRMPSYDGSVGGLRKIIARSNPDRIKNLTDLASVLKINPTELLVFFKNINLTEKLSYYTLNFFVKILDEDKNFRMFLLKQHQVERSIVQEYLRQEIDLVDEHFAFVEVGGTGFTQKCLYNLMKSAYSGKIYTFFLKMDRIIEDEVCKYFNFLPSKLKHDLVFELLCRAPHGQTAGYMKDNDGVKPVLQGNEGTFLKKYGYDMYIRGIEKYCELYAEQVKKYNMPVNLQIFMEYMEYVMSPKDKEILDFFSDMPYSPSGRDEEMVTFAPILTKQNIRDVYLFHPTEPFTKYYHGTDLEYAKHRCNKSEIKRIEFYQKNRERILDRLQRLTKKSFAKKHTVRDNIFLGMPYSYFGDDFVIYGAGKWGIQLYEALSAENYTIVQWLDKNYHALQKEGIAVTGTLSDIVNEKNYGSIFIAISDRAVAQKIKDEFLAKGVNDSKIVILCEYVRALEL